MSHSARSHVFGTPVRFRLRRLVGHTPLFEIARRQCFNCSIFGEFESAQAADSMRSVLVRKRAQRTRGTVVH